ncbi:unnamed protein product [Citrullus colocynthis]|uniref:Uncharacterized protein n=1 Tax=Citrullus colocynthis TaxID=252529 RepID=A0ABP0Y0J6_9ROSI
METKEKKGGNEGSQGRGEKETRDGDSKMEESKENGHEEGRKEKHHLTVIVHDLRRQRVRWSETRTWQKWKHRLKKVDASNRRGQTLLLRKRDGNRKKETEDGAPTSEHMVRKAKRKVGGKSTEHEVLTINGGRTKKLSLLKDTEDGWLRWREKTLEIHWMGWEKGRRLEMLKKPQRAQRRRRVGSTAKGKVVDDECNFVADGKGSRDERRGKRAIV